MEGEGTKGGWKRGSSGMEETKALRSGGIDTERCAPDVDTDAQMT